MHALYIIGEPGVGKSTLVEALTDGLPYEETDSPFAMRRYDCGPLELGRRRAAFSGTDALAMNVQPIVEQFLLDVRPALLLGEGDRLGNGRFFDFLRFAGYRVHIVHLEAREETLAARRAERGSNQNESWMRGRETKVRRLAYNQPNVRTLAAEASVRWLAESLDDPVSMSLKAARSSAAAA